MSLFAYDDLIGVPFVPGGRDQAHGLDCYGLAMECFARMGIRLPDPFKNIEQLPTPDGDVGAWTEAFIARHFLNWRRIPAPEAGCAVAIRNDGELHIGVMVNERQFLHSLRQVNACLNRIDREPWASRLLGAYAYCG